MSVLGNWFLTVQGGYLFLFTDCFRTLLQPLFKQENGAIFDRASECRKTSLVNVIATGGYSEDPDALRYVVDAADHDNLAISKGELHDLLSKPSLHGIPLLVLGNKVDKPEALSKPALTDQMELKSITDREVCCFMISCKNSTNIDSVIDWLVKHSKSKS
ncbi:hypothetical protein HHK36_032697 [Tetracentron sinense]|uniref:Uncharacterized protein n=1 Tax=Tetracentron sinense TaxID=13715 RepID=A0A834Y6M6_TETSI|nr:hypothetical protein HHK36_032697 [Tetracentron sinense]